MRNMTVILIGCFGVLTASTGLGQNASLGEPTARPGSMLRKLLQGEPRMGRNGVPADRTYQAHAIADEPHIPGEVYITDEYGFKYDRHGNRVR
jgi:hypothetical protein